MYGYGMEFWGNWAIFLLILLVTSGVVDFNSLFGSNTDDTGEDDLGDENLPDASYNAANFADTFLGSDTADVMSLSAFAEDDQGVAAFAYDDSDTVIGSDFADHIEGDAGSDQISGGGGDDIIFGGSGFDTLQGGDGADKINGDTDDDEILGGAGDDTLIGGSGNDQIRGGPGVDELRGGSGDDFLVFDETDTSTTGVEGVEKLYGQDGNDSLLFSVQDIASGGSGADSFEFAAVDLDLGVATITDFDASEDSLTIYYSGGADTTEPAISFRVDDDANTTTVALDGVDALLLENVTDLQESDITLTPVLDLGTAPSDEPPTGFFG